MSNGDRYRKHKNLADDLSKSTEAYVKKVNDAVVLANYLSFDHERVSHAFDNADLARRQLRTDLNWQMNGASVLAASPAFAGPMTRPYRVVLLQYADGSFSAHTVYLDDLGGKDYGHYFKYDEYEAAMKKWLERTTYEVNERGPACYAKIPV